MHRLRYFLATLALAGAVACSDDKGPTAPADETPSMQLGGTPVATGLTIPVNQVFGAVTVTQVTITELTRQGSQILASGVLTFTTAAGTFTQAFEDIPITIDQQDRRCQILFLDLGPIFLNLLGLEVNLSQITLDIDAVPGPGNLLGNLLCALVGLLDQNPLDFAGIDRLLQLINDLLGG